MNPLKTLRHKTEKLRNAQVNLNKGIENDTQTLKILQGNIMQQEIELQLINEAFQMKFGDMSSEERNKAINAMRQILEIERLEAELAIEEERTRQLQNEVERLQDIAPTIPTENIDINEIENEKNMLQSQIQTLIAINRKREKNIKLTEGKLTYSDNEHKDLQDRALERQDKEIQAEKQRKRASIISEEIQKITQAYKEKNKEMRVIQERYENTNKTIDDLQSNYINNIPIYRGKIEQAREYKSAVQNLSEINAYFEKLKNDHLEFETYANQLNEQMNQQLIEITILCDVVRAELE